jgi:DNA-directed RNA polymerase specialized sigma24 family protein
VEVHLQTMVVTERQIVNELQNLEPEKLGEVLDFIDYLKHRKAATKKAQPHSQDLTAQDLLQSGLVGLWANRDDIGDSPDFARSLRRKAEHRWEPPE